MNPGPSKIKRERAIAALLSPACRTNEDAAKTAGVSLSTLKRLLADATFQAELTVAREAAFDGMIRKLEASTSLAVDTLVNELCGRKANSRIRAALGLLTNAIKTRELHAMIKRIEEMEQTIKELQNVPGRTN